MEEIPESMKFALKEGQIVILKKLFDSQAHGADTFVAKCKKKSIFCVCEAADGDVYGGFMSNYDPSKAGYIRDENAFITVASEKEVYRPSKKHEHDIYYDAISCGPMWGMHNLYLGKLDSTNKFSGARCDPHPSYPRCNFPPAMITVQRLRVFSAIRKKPFELVRSFFEGNFKRVTLPIMMIDDELAAFQEIFKGMSSYNVGRKLVLSHSNDTNISTQLVNRNERTVSLNDAQTLEKLCKYKGSFKTAPFLVLEVSGCTKEHAELVASLFSDDNNVFNHNRMRYLRIIVDSDKTAEMGAEVARMCPKHLDAVEFCPASGDALSAPIYDIITSVPANHKLNVKLFVINSVTPRGVAQGNTIDAIRTNFSTKFILQKVSAAHDPSFLEREAMKRFTEIPVVDLPAVVPFRDVKWGKMFGLQTAAGLVRCDFKDLHKHSVTLQSMYDPAKDGKEPTEPLEKYAGSNIAVRTVAVQLVVLFVSAKDNKGKPMFVSEEATKDAKQNPSTWCLSLNHQKFLSYISANSSSSNDEMLLCSEILGIASFLHMPALQRLIRMQMSLLFRSSTAKDT